MAYISGLTAYISYWYVNFSQCVRRWNCVDALKWLKQIVWKNTDRASNGPSKHDCIHSFYTIGHLKNVFRLEYRFLFGWYIFVGSMKCEGVLFDDIREFSGWIRICRFWLYGCPLHGTLNEVWPQLPYCRATRSHRQPQWYWKQRVSSFNFSKHSFDNYLYISLNTVGNVYHLLSKALFTCLLTDTTIYYLIQLQHASFIFYVRL